MPTAIDELPPNEKTFTVEVPKGETSGQRYVGKFTCRCVLNIGQRTAADVAEARLNEGLKDVRENTRVMHMVLAQLEARVTHAPKWWIASEGGRLLMDENVVLEIYRQCLAAETEWRTQVWGEPEKTPPKVEETEEKETDAGAGKA